MRHAEKTKTKETGELIDVDLTVALFDGKQ